MEFIREYSGLLWVVCGLTPFILMSIYTAITKEDYSFTKDFSENPSAGQAFIICLLFGPFTILIFGSMFISELLRTNKMKRIIKIIVKTKACPKCKSSNIYISTDKYKDETSTCVEFDCRDCDLEHWARMELKDIKELEEII